MRSTLLLFAEVEPMALFRSMLLTSPVARGGPCGPEALEMDAMDNVDSMDVADTMDLEEC